MKLNLFRELLVLLSEKVVQCMKSSALWTQQMVSRYIFRLG